MSPYVGPKEIIRIVTRGIKRHDPDGKIVEELVSKGVPSHEAPTLFNRIREALQQGALSVRTGGRSSPDGPPKDPVLAEAWKVGRKDLRSDLRGSKTRSCLLVVAILAVILLVVLFVLPG